MKKILVILFLAAVTLSSCLKDKPNTDFSSISTVIELPYAGLQYFGSDAITDAGPTITKSFGINIASKNTLSTDTKYTIAVDYTLMTAYNAANSAVVYEQMPAGSYTISKTAGTIAAGKRLDSVTVTFNKSLLDPTKSYMLPIKLVSATNGILSGNFNAHYYHFIGNDFATTYAHQFTRTPSASSFPFSQGNTATFVPNSATEFEVVGGYYTQTVRYVVDFSKPTATTYNNFTIAIDASDNANILNANGITVTTPPSIVGYDPTATYTKDQVLQLFLNGFQYDVVGGSGARHNLDQYKPL